MSKSQIIYRKIDEIKPYENNPRKNDEAVQYVVNSIKEFGFRSPIIIDRNDVIIAGHTRLEAAKVLKLKEVPTLKADDLTEEQVKALRLADNKTAELSEWDTDLLDIELGGIELDMSAFGFDAGITLSDEFGEGFSLPNTDKSDVVTMSFTLSTEQMETVQKAIDTIDTSKYKETGPNMNGTALYGVCLEWAEQRK